MLGRKKLGEMKRSKVIQIKLTEEEYKRVRGIADSLDIQTSIFARNLLLATLDSVEMYHSLGILKGVKSLMEFKFNLNLKGVFSYKEKEML